MYRCAITGKQSEVGDKCNRLVIETRPKTYKHWDREEEKEWFTQGTEIVREVNASAEGLAIWDGMTDEQRALLAKSL